MCSSIKIYVALLNENVDVWRPVSAVHLDGNTYRIENQPYDRKDEQWQFEPGDTVLCKTVDLEEGPALVAIKRISSKDT